MAFAIFQTPRSRRCSRFVFLIIATIRSNRLLMRRAPGFLQQLIFQLQLRNIFFPVAASQFAGDLLMCFDAAAGQQQSSFGLLLGIKLSLHRANPPCAAPRLPHQWISEKARRIDAPGFYGSGEENAP